MKRLLFVFPTVWDRRQLESCRAEWQGRFEVLFGSPTHEECPYGFDLIELIDRWAKDPGEVAGVLSSSDYPGAMAAAAIATARGWPGAAPDRVLSCSHKFLSRLAQQGIVPEAVPRFHLVDAADPQDLELIGYPGFVKPVKGAFSILSQRVDSPEELEGFLVQPAVAEYTREHMAMFDRLLSRYSSTSIGGRYFLVEELLKGWQVTVEGFRSGGTVEVLGVVDSVLHPNQKSFIRFDYPSFLPAEVQARMEDIARRVIAGVGLNDSFFNIEMIYEPAFETIRIIEINPRICGQFADLYEKVDGRNSYVQALELAAGEKPAVGRRSGRYAHATSFPLRVFEPVRVEYCPGEEDLRCAEALFPGTLCWVETETGQELSDFSFEDGQSSRYAIVNLGADSREELLERLAQVESRLRFRFERLTGSASDEVA